VTLVRFCSRALFSLPCSPGSSGRSLKRGGGLEIFELAMMNMADLSHAKIPSPSTAGLIFGVWKQPLQPSVHGVPNPTYVLWTCDGDRILTHRSLPLFSAGPWTIPRSDSIPGEQLGPKTLLFPAVLLTHL